MATGSTNYSINVNTQPAQAALASLQQYVTGVASRMSQAFAGVNTQSRSATQQLGAGLGRIGAGASAAHGGVSGLLGSISSLGAVGGVVMGGLAAVIGGKVVGALIECGKQAAVAEQSFRALEASANANGDGIVRSWTAVTDLFKKNGGLVSKDAIADSIKNLRDYGYSLDEAVTATQRLIDRAAYNRQGHYDMSEAVRITTEGIRNENSALSDATKMSENMSSVLEKYARAHQTTVEGLTQSQRAHATYEWILRETAQNSGDAQRATNDLGGAFAKVSTSWDGLKEAVGGELEPTFNFVGKAISGLLDGITWVVRKLRGLDDTVVSLYNGAKRFMGLGDEAKNKAAADANSAPPPTGALPPVPANNSSIPPVPGGIGLPPVAVIDGPTRNTRGVTDNVNAALVAERAKRQAEEDARKAAAGQLVLLNRQLEEQKASAQGEVLVFKAAQDQKQAALESQLKRQQITQAQYARAIQDNESANLRKEEEQRSARIALLEKAKENATKASDLQAEAGLKAQLATEYAERKANVDKLKKAGIDAGTAVFEADKATAQEQRTLNETRLKSIADAAKTTNDSINAYDQAALDRLHEQKLIGEDEYLQKSLALNLRAMDQEVDALKKRQAYLATLKPVDKADAAAIKAEQTTLTADIDAAARRRDQAIEDNATKRKLSAIEIAKLERELDQELLAQQGKTLAAETASIDAWLAEKRQELAALPEQLARAEAIGAQKKSNAQFDDNMRIVGRNKTALDLTDQEMQAQVAAGTLTATEAEMKLRAEREKTLAVMKLQLDAAEQLALASGNPEQLQAIRQARLESAQLANQNKAFGISMRDGLVSDFKAGWNEVLRTGAKGSDVLRGIVINSLTKLSDHYLDKAVDGLLKGATGEGLANFFQKLGDDAGGAFVDAVKAGWDIIKSLFSGLADMLSNAFSSSGSGGSGGGGWLSAIGSLFSDGGGYATGGLINGPGTDTSDSIVARLSRGEFVLKASAVRGLGVGAVQYMNTHGRLPKHAFASGGGFALPSMGSGGGGMTNNYWQNMVHIDSAHMLEALKREPGFNRHITGVVGDNKKAIQGAWG